MDDSDFIDLDEIPDEEIDDLLKEIQRDNSQLVGDNPWVITKQKLLTNLGIDIYGSNEYIKYRLHLLKMGNNTSKQRFDEFYEENKSKLPTIKSYPLDYANIDKWINMQQDDCSRTWALLFKKYARHVSFAEFFGKMNKIIADLVLHIESNRYDNIVLYFINDDVKKSGVWLALLLYQSIRNYITRVEISTGFVDTVTTKTLLLYLDDMSFSGSQIYDELLKSLSNRKGVDNVEVYMAMPFFTEKAFKKIATSSKKIKYIIPDSHEIIPLFQDQVKSDSVYRDKYDDYSKCPFPINDNLPIIYFDHKLADSVSTYPSLFLMGRMKRFDGNRISLIQNCDPSSYNEIYSCPPPTYKDMVHTFLGKKVTSFSFLNTTFFVDTDFDNPNIKYVIEPRSFGAEKSRYTLLNNVLHGLEQEWYSNGDIKYRVNYDNGVKQGLEEKWYKNERLASRTKYVNGVKQGLYKEWYESGNIKLQVKYVKGVKQGVQKEWYETGELLSQTNYVDNLRHGLEERWHKNGQLQYRANYENDYKQGIEEQWYEDGNIATIIKFLNNKMVKRIK